MILGILVVLLALLLLICLLLEHLRLSDWVSSLHWARLILIGLNVVLLMLGPLIRFFALVALGVLALVVVFWLVTLSLRVVRFIFIRLELPLDKLIHCLLVVQVCLWLFPMASSRCLVALGSILWLGVSYRNWWMAPAWVERHRDNAYICRLLCEPALLLVVSWALNTRIRRIVLHDQILRVVIVAEIYWLTVLIMLHSFVLFLFQCQFSLQILIKVNQMWIFRSRH